MLDLDEELIARAIRWCADAGRQASPGQIRAALGPLSWDELLLVRARLADPPPARPLGPWALADLGRGALPEVAAERERAGQYADDPPGVPELPSPPERAPKPRSERARKSGASSRVRVAVAPVVRRARDRVVKTVERATDRRSLLETLVESEGRAVLERLIREHGARRSRLVDALVAGWRHLDGAKPGSEDLDRLLRAHGLARAFERRERDELLHTLRATGGVLSAAAVRVGASAEELTASLARLGATDEAEAIRDVHRRDVRRRATLSERVRLLLTDAVRLADLGVLREIEDDLRLRLPEHLRALRASGAAPLATALVQTLAMGPSDLPILLARLQLTLDLGAPRAPSRSGAERARSPRRATSPRPAGDRPRSSPRSPPRSPPRRPGPPRSPPSRTGPARSPLGRSAPPRRPSPPRGGRTRSK